MIFENIDYLSPKITLFYKYKTRHSSPIGGFLTSLLAIICILFILKFITDIIFHSSPSVLFYRKYEKNLSKYSLNTSSISHLIWIKNKNNNNLTTIINNKAIRVILLAEENNYEINRTNLINYEHWVYDSCQKEDFYNYEKIIFNDDYINDNNITNAICIRYFYNKTEKKYYSSKSKDLNNFKYPYLENGISNKKNAMLTIFIEKCSNNSITKDIFGYCEKEEIIQEYVNHHNLVYIQILDHQVDLTNYKKPLQSYFMGISSFFLHNQGYEVKNINLSPLLIRSNQNIINNEYIEKNTIIIEDVNSIIINNNDGHFLLKFLLSLENYKQIYQRKYNDIFDSFSSIGGIIQFFYYVFYLINYFYYDFILILNTQNLFLNDQKSKKISNLIPVNKYQNTISKNRNNTLLNYYESSNMLPDFQYLKLMTKNKSKNDGDISSIQLSESNYDKDSQFIFSQKKKENTLGPNVRRSEQLNYKNMMNFNLKDEIKKKGGYRNSMFNPKNTVIISPIHKFSRRERNFTNFLNSSNYLDNNESKKIFQNLQDKNITLIDNRDKHYNNNNLQNNSFVENIKIGNQLKNKKQLLNFDNKIKKKNEMKKTPVDCSKEKYYSQKLNFSEYLRFSCSLRNKRRDILIIQKFRQKLLSEEHFFKSHLFIYLIIQKIKIDKEDKSDIKELYSEL